MKITLLTEAWNETGGIQNYLKNVAARLAEEHEVEIIEPQKKKFFWPIIKPAWLPLLLHLQKKAKRSELDVLLCGKGLFEGLLAFHLKKKTGTPYIVFTYAMEIKTWSQNKKTKKKLIKALSEAAKVVYINDVTKKDLAALGVAEEKLVKIAPGVDQRHLNNVSPELVSSYKKHYGIADDYILSVGRLIPRKGFDLLIDAFAQLDQTKFSDVDLVIIGQGPEQDELVEQAENAWIGPRVKFLKNVPDKHLPALYAGAKAFALLPRETTTDMEGFGIVYLEAAAQGVPAIGTKTGGVPEAVLHEQTGLIVEPDNEKETAAALTKILTDEDFAKQLGEAGRKRTQNEFTWDARVQKVNDLLKNIAKS